MRSWATDKTTANPNGPAQAGDTCASPTDCARDTYCLNLGDDLGQCQAICYDNRDCPENTYCTSTSADAGVCYPFGTLEAGASCAGNPTGCGQGMVCGGPDPVCLPSCTTNPNGCPSDMYCLPPATRDTPRYCYPSGTTPAGDACTDPYACEPTFCTGDATNPGRCAVGYCRSNANAPTVSGATEASLEPVHTHRNGDHRAILRGDRVRCGSLVRLRRHRPSLLRRGLHWVRGPLRRG